MMSYYYYYQSWCYDGGGILGLHEFFEVSSVVLVFYTHGFLPTVLTWNEPQKVKSVIISDATR